VRNLGPVSGEYPFTDVIVSAWANVDGDDATPFIRAQHNVTAIADNGVSDWTLTFAIQLPLANYFIVGIGNDDTTSATSDGIVQTQPFAAAGSLAATSMRVTARQRSVVAVDSHWVSVIACGKA
jgi:hypothetical protein